MKICILFERLQYSFDIFSNNYHIKQLIHIDVKIRLFALSTTDVSKEAR